MCRLFLAILVAVVASLCAACASVERTPEPVRLLFVGNSLTYVGNLPAVLDALAAAQGKSVRSDMIVKGGSTLTERVADGSVQRALAESRYDYVVLQERGGDMICAFGPASCKEAEASLGELARIAVAHGARPAMLGTYQSVAQVSTALVEAEAAAATRLSIAHVPVSDRLQVAIASTPAAEWLHADRAHPGHDLVLLEAALLYHHLFGALPEAAAFTVHAPMYGPAAKFGVPAPTSRGIPSDDVATVHDYSKARVGIVLAIAAGKPP